MASSRFIPVALARVRSSAFTTSSLTTIALLLLALSASAQRSTQAANTVDLSTLVTTPTGRISSGLNPAYLNGFPAVDVVKRTIQGSDPTDTLARQVAVFNTLSARIQHHLANNQHAFQLSPDEVKVKYAYDLASYQIEQEYKKTHAPAEANAFAMRHNQIESDWAIEKEIDTKLLSTQAVAENRANDSGAFQQLKAHNDAIVRQNEEAKARGEAAEKARAQGMRAPLNDPGAQEVRRCLELGGSDLECLGKGMKTGMFDLLGFNPKDLTGPSRAGLVLTGNYNGGTNSVSAGFTDGGMNISGCGKLVNVNPAYTLTKRGNQMLIHVANTPQPFTAVLGADGNIVGPGMTVVDGQVIVGYNRTWVEKRYTADNTVVPGSGHYESTPIYGPARDRCNIGVMQPVIPKKEDGNAGGPSAIVGMVAGLSKVMGIEASTVGLRMIGEFSGSGGLKVQFGHDKAVLDCGEAHIIAEYAVANTPSQLEVTVNNPSSPMRLALQADGSLAGSGMVDVSGRVMVGENANREIVYRPANTHCAVGTLAANGKVINAEGSPAAAKVAPAPGVVAPAATASGAVAPTAVSDPPRNATATPSTAAANGVLSVQVGMPGGSAFVGHSLMLMKDSFDNIMRKLGAPLPAGASALDAWKVFLTACRPPSDCRPLKAALAQYVASGVNVDASGKATFAGLSPATYYVTGNSMFNNQPTFWNVAVVVKPGQTSLQLDQNNGVPLK